MGDRGNIKFVGPTISGEKQGDIYLYTHSPNLFQTEEEKHETTQLDPLGQNK